MLLTINTVDTSESLDLIKVQAQHSHMHTHFHTYVLASLLLRFHCSRRDRS